MSVAKNVELFKALADKSRLLILNTLSQKPGYVEELAETIDLSPSTVSFHLSKLEKSGLIHKKKDQYYTIFTLNEDILKNSLSDFITIETDEEREQKDRNIKYKQKIISTFFENGKLKQIPTQKKKRQIILLEIAKQFDAKKVYSEQEISKEIAAFHEDYCSIRRYMIEEHLLERNEGMYRIINKPEEPSFVALCAKDNTEIKQKDKELERRALLKQTYKEMKHPIGVFMIKCENNGKMLLGKSYNIPSTLNRYRFELRLGSQINEDLQKDYNEFGKFAFTFEALEELDTSKIDEVNIERELNNKLNHWMEKLQPFDEKGYHKSKNS